MQAAQVTLLPRIVPTESAELGSAGSGESCKASQERSERTAHAYSDIIRGYLVSDASSLPGTYDQELEMAGVECNLVVESSRPSFQSDLMQAGMLPQQSGSSDVSFVGPVCRASNSSGVVVFPSFLHEAGMQMPFGWTADVGSQCTWPSPAETFNSINAVTVQTPLVSWSMRAWDLNSSRSAPNCTVGLQRSVLASMDPTLLHPSTWLDSWRTSASGLTEDIQPWSPPHPLAPILNGSTENHDRVAPTWALPFGRGGSSCHQGVPAWPSALPSTPTHVQALNPAP